VTGLGSPLTCSVQFVNENILGETICCVITGMFTEEVAEEEAEEEEEEEVEEEAEEEEEKEMEEEAEEDEKAEEAEEEAEAEEEVRGSLSIGNPFSFVMRSRQTLRTDRLWKNVFC
jgi:archaellum component FlaD/FlaE